MANFSAPLSARGDRVDPSPVFRALADPTRRAIVAALGRGPASVSALAEPFPMALPSFVKHLAILERSGLVRSRKIGRVRTCELRPQALAPAERWMNEQRALWESRTDRLTALAERLHQENPSHGYSDPTDERAS